VTDDDFLLIVHRLKIYRSLLVTCRVASSRGKMSSIITRLLSSKKLGETHIPRSQDIF